MDRGAWQAKVYVVATVGHDLATREREKERERERERDSSACDTSLTHIVILIFWENFTPLNTFDPFQRERECWKMFRFMETRVSFSQDLLLKCVISYIMFEIRHL